MRNGLFFERLVLTCTILLMNDLGLVRCTICWRFWFSHLKISQNYLFWDIWVFVMYYIYGISGPSLLIESTDSMIYVLRQCVWHFQILMNQLSDQWFGASHITVVAKGSWAFKLGLRTMKWALTLYLGVRFFLTFQLRGTVLDPIAYLSIATTGSTQCSRCSMRTEIHKNRSVAINFFTSGKLLLF